MIPKWPRRVNAPTQNGWLIPKKVIHSMAKYLKLRILILTAISSYVSTYIKRNPKFTKGNLVSYLNREESTYIHDRYRKIMTFQIL